MPDKIVDDSTFLGFWAAMEETGGWWPINAGDVKAHILVINGDGKLEYKRPENVVR